MFKDLLVLQELLSQLDKYDKSERHRHFALHCDASLRDKIESLKAALEMYKSNKAYMEKFERELEERNKRDEEEKLQVQIKAELVKWSKGRNKILTNLKVATYTSWKAMGVNVRSGQKAHDVDGVKVFHISQTDYKG